MLGRCPASGTVPGYDLAGVVVLEGAGGSSWLRRGCAERAPVPLDGLAVVPERHRAAAVWRRGPVHGRDHRAAHLLDVTG
ncbi:hypothetical protein GCM10010300_20140 [Streptomyces olivaceoviridis]|nr:hypothetical protein GCM10010300_20140 [Streptomyces olivaceoviridis]